MLSKSSDSRHCERSEETQYVDYQWIASIFHSRNDVVKDFQNSLRKIH